MAADAWEYTMVVSGLCGTLLAVLALFSLSFNVGDGMLLLFGSVLMNGTASFIWAVVRTAERLGA